MGRLEISENGLSIDGKPFYLASGDMHYFRTFKSGWRKRLKLMKAFGLTAVQTYVPWNLHEAEKGEFCFEGNLDLGGFLTMCREEGLYVMLRPAPYICSEWDLGGLPYWLLKDRDMAFRTSDPVYMKHLEEYYARLVKEIIPHLSTNGGAVIAVAPENEYGSFGDDKEYIKAVAEMLRKMGIDVPFFTANGWDSPKLQNGSNKEFWNSIDLHELTDEAVDAIKSYQPDKPIYVGEFWGGRSQQWGGFFGRQTPESVAEKYRDMLEKGAYVNFYMFCGGTNFGFQNGALEGRYSSASVDEPNRYIPFCTSYDVDALISEDGSVTEKYELCRKVLQDFLKNKGFDVSKTEEAEKSETQKIEKITLEQSADFFDNLENLAVKTVKSGKPMTFESLGQAYGFVVYRTNIDFDNCGERAVSINGLHDRAMIFVDGKYIGSFMRDRGGEPLKFSVPPQGATMDILVENMGRVNYGAAMTGECKGILGYVRIASLNLNGEVSPWDYTLTTGWTNYSVPMKDLSKIDYKQGSKTGRPAFFRGEFTAKAGVDSFLDMRGWEKGVAFINGFNLGRYWNIGPQETLYIPGDLIKENNVIEIFELHSPKSDLCVSLSEKPMIDKIPAKTKE